MVKNGRVPDAFVVCDGYSHRNWLLSMRKYNFMPKITIFNPLLQSEWYSIEPELRDYMVGVLEDFVSS